jgi:hypothetical protein
MVRADKYRANHHNKLTNMTSKSYHQTRIRHPINLISEELPVYI